jgi:hypothetical protein
MSIFSNGTKAHAEALKDEVAAVLSTMGLRLSEETTMIAHIDEGFDFLGHADLRVMPTSLGSPLLEAASGLMGSA